MVFTILDVFPTGEQSDVEMTGFAYRIRDLKERVFVEFMTEKTTDVLMVVQEKSSDGFPCVHDEEDMKRYMTDPDGYFTDPNTHSLHLHEYMPIRIRGSVVQSPKSGQEFEFQCLRIGGLVPLAPFSKEFPYSTRGKYPPEFFRQLPHLKFYERLYQAIARATHRIRSSLTGRLDDRGYIQVDLPLTTSSECEGGSHQLTVTSLFDQPLDSKKTQEELFKSDFYGRRVYLSGSQQLLLEPIALNLKKAYCMTRATRGEPSMTSKHVSEFLMIEYEATFPTLKDNYETVIDAITHTIQKLAQDSDVAFLRKHYGLPELSVPEFAITTHEDCVRRMLEDVEAGKVVFGKQPSYTDDVASEHEKYITDVLFGGRPVVLRYFPENVKSFYMPRLPSDLESAYSREQDIHHVDCFDILVPRVGEIVGGSQREYRYPELMQKIRTLGLDPRPLEFYTSLRKFGCVPHGGMGLGFERLVMYITGIPNIRDVQTYPRAIGECPC